MISRNYEEIKRVLQAASTDPKMKAQHRQTATGLLHYHTKPVFRVLLAFVKELLDLVAFLTLSFQTVNSSIVSCMETVEDLTVQLLGLKDLYNRDHVCSLLGIDPECHGSNQLSGKRKRKVPNSFNDSVVEHNIPHYRSSDSLDDFVRIIGDIIDSFINELEGRFSEANSSIWKSFQSLTPVFGEEQFLNGDKLDSLLQYSMAIPALRCSPDDGGLGDDLSEARDDLKSESRLFKKRLLAISNGIGDQARPQATEILLQHCQSRSSMRTLSNLYKVSVVAGYSVASVENVFSARKRIQTPSRRKLTPYKQGNLTLLHFEKKYLRDVSFPEFLKHFKSKGNRRLKL